MLSGIFGPKMVEVSITAGRSKLHNYLNNLYCSLIIAEMSELIRNYHSRDEGRMFMYVFKGWAKTHQALALRPPIVLCDEGGKKCVTNVCQQLQGKRSDSGHRSRRQY